MLFGLKNHQDFRVFRRFCGAFSDRGATPDPPDQRPRHYLHARHTAVRQSQRGGLFVCLLMRIWMAAP